MTSSSQMIQVYQDEEGSVGEHAPFLPHPPLNDANPRWAKHSSRRTRLRRLAIASGAFLTLYLLFCTWVAYARNEIFESYGGLPGQEFPHRKFPWPFPKRPHHPPKPLFKPTVLGCTAVPTPSEDSSVTSVELKVAIPEHHILILEDHLIWGDVSVSKVAQDSDMATLSEKNLTVGITIANRTCPHHPPKSAMPFGDEDSEEKERKFVLCALQFTPGHHKGNPHPDGLSEKPGHPHPHPHPHPFPHPPPHVTVAVLPAHNETYPRLPGPHHPPPPPPPPGHPPHDGPGEGDEEAVEMSAVVAQPASVFSRAWRSTLSFLFPMLPILSDSFPQHWTHPFPHHPPHGHPPPPPPFIVTSLTVSVPKFVPVKYGIPFRHFRHHWRH